MNGMAENEIIYQSHEGQPSASLLEELNHLYMALFEDADPDFFKQRIALHPELMVVTARQGDELVGFKLGYPIIDNTFYSWVGGVAASHRKAGIAFKMADLQEQYARENGFEQIKTKSMNRFKPMMQLNLKRGFDITKVYTNEKGQTKIVFKKRLD